MRFFSDLMIAAVSGIIALYAMGRDKMQDGTAGFVGLLVFIVVYLLLDRWRRSQKSD